MDLKDQIKGLCEKNKEGSLVTQKSRRKCLQIIAHQLYQIGYNSLEVTDLELEHISALLNHWRVRGISLRSIKNCLSYLRWWAEKIGKPEIIPEVNCELNVGKCKPDGSIRKYQLSGICARQKKEKKNLKFQLHRLCANNKEGTLLTQAVRHRALQRIADQLHQLGFVNLDVYNLELEHVEALFNCWKASDSCPGTIKNRLSYLRWWARKIGSFDILPKKNGDLVTGQKNTVNILNVQLKEICLQNKEGRLSTQAFRYRSLQQMAKQLYKLGFHNLEASDLELEHVSALLNHWKSSGISVGSIRNSLAHIRWWAKKIGKLETIPTSNADLNIG